MISRELLQLLIYLLLPFLFKKVSEYSRQLQTSPRHQHTVPFTRSEFAAAALLISTISYHLYYAFVSPPANIFQYLRVPIKTPVVHLKALLLKHNALTPTNDLLLGKLTTLDSRSIYVAYGQQSILECEYCHEPNDYLYYALPILASCYILQFTVLGLATMTPRKSDWRKYSVIFVVACGALDLYNFTTLNVRQLPNNTDQFPYATSDFWRRIAFVVCNAILLYMNKQDTRTDLEVLNNIGRLQETVLAKLKGSMLQRQAIMRDTKLRELYVNFYKSIETEESILFGDPEYQKAKAGALAKLNVEQLRKDAELYVENLIRMKELKDIEENDVYVSANSAASSSFNMGKMENRD